MKILTGQAIKDAEDRRDLAAHDAWIDGPGESCATTTGIWFAAIAYERARKAREITLVILPGMSGPN